MRSCRSSLFFLIFKTGQEIFKKSTLHKIFERNSRNTYVKRKNVLCFIYVLCKVKLLSLNLLQQHYHRASFVFPFRIKMKGDPINSLKV